MRSRRILPTLAVLPLLVATLMTTGCNLLEEFYVPGQHFQFGTVKQIELAKPVSDVVQTVQIVLKEQEFNITKVDQQQDSAQVWATKDMRSYVFDIKGQGSGVTIRLEIDQAGNDGAAWTLMQQIQSMP